MPKCPGCGGPAELECVRHARRHDLTECKHVYYALPDTLEGIQADVNIAIQERRGDNWSVDVATVALTRIFQGCAKCGRAPLDRNGSLVQALISENEAAKRLVATALVETHFAKRQALQQVAEMADSRVGTESMADFAAKVRQMISEVP